MRKFLISSPKFSGNIEMVFNQEGVLMSVSFVNASLTIGQIQFVLKHTPAVMDGLNGSEAFKGAIIAEDTYEITFEMWFDKYNFKRNKKPAEKIWAKMNTVDKVLAYYNTDSYLRHLKNTEWQNQMYPDTYLRNEHYRTEWDKLKR